MEGIILKALSGFYYVDGGDGVLVACRGRGKFRHQRITPLVGDKVIFTPLDNGAGILDEILPRRNEFQRPAVANIDQLVVIASGAIPVTDPFLIDRVVSIAEGRNCQPVICINKCDLDAAEELYQTYRAAGFPTLRVSAETGEGLEELSGQLLERLLPLQEIPVWANPAYSTPWSPASASRWGRSPQAGPWPPYYPPCGAVSAPLRRHCGRYPRLLLLRHGGDRAPSP